MLGFFFRRDQFHACGYLIPGSVFPGSNLIQSLEEPDKRTWAFEANDLYDLIYGVVRVF